MNPNCLLLSERERARESPQSSREGEGGWVVRWCWINYQCRGVLFIWKIGPIALAASASGDCLDIFSLVYLFFGNGAINPKQQTDQIQS